MNAAEPEVIAGLINSSCRKEKYGEAVDRESAYELLTGQYEQNEKEKAEAEAEKKAEEERKAAEKQAEAERKQREKEEREREREEKAKEKEKKAKSSKRKQSTLGKAVNSTANTFGRKLGEALFRGLFGTRRK
jgi:hypothetical protein